MVSPAKPTAFSIRNNDRVFIVGSTGSGKTALAKALLYGLSNVVVLDSKRTFTLPESWPKGWAYYEDLRAMDNHEEPSQTLIYRPSPDEIDTNCEAFFQWIFDRENTIVFVDEAGDVTSSTRIGKAYDRCIRLGREKQIGVWSATQRPRNISPTIMTESEHYIMFRLRSVDDRKRVSDFTIPEIKERNPSGHGFWYYNDRTQKVTYYPYAKLGKVLS